MSKRVITAGLLISTLLLTAVTPVLGVAAADTTPANSNSETVSALSSSDSITNSITSDGQTTAVSTTDNASEKTSGDKIQTLTSQTMILKKIVVKNGKVESQVGSIGVSDSDVKGINGAVFKVYDVTDLMNTILKEQLKTDTKINADTKQIDQAIDSATTQDESGQATTGLSSSSASQTSTIDSSSQPSGVSKDSSDSSTQTSSSKTAQVDKELEAKVKALTSNDTLRNLVAERAAKMDMGKLKTVATVTTATDKKLKSDGVASVKLPIDGKYHAYYVVNTSTPKEAHATNSDPIVVFTPVSQDDGVYAENFTIFPKSDSIPKPQAKTPATVTSVKMYQTGTTKQHSWLDKLIDTVWNWF